MKPDRSNYEIWLIDYLDGNLDKNQVDQLMLFLDENPDIKEESDSLLTINIKPVPYSYKFKNSLKRKESDISEKQFEYLCISAAENDLSETQLAELQEIIAVNPYKRKILDYYKRAVLVAPDLKFTNKSRLRKLSGAQKIIRLSFIGLSAAAGIGVLVTLFNMVGKKEEINLPKVSSVLKSDSSKTEETSPLPPSKGEYKNSTLLIASTEEVTSALPPSKGDAKNSTLLIASTEEVTSALPPSKGESKNSTPATSAEGELVPVNIAKLDFKHDVQMDTDIPWNVPVIKEITIQSPGITEKPGFNNLIAKLFREKILKHKTPESGSLKAYEIADAGIIGLNKLFGWQMSLKENRNEKGELTSLYFSSRILKFNAPVKKSQENVAGS